MLGRCHSGDQESNRCRQPHPAWPAGACRTKRDVGPGCGVSDPTSRRRVGAQSVSLRLRARDDTRDVWIYAGFHFRRFFLFLQGLLHRAFFALGLLFFLLFSFTNAFRITCGSRSCHGAPPFGMRGTRAGRLSGGRVRHLSSGVAGRITRRLRPFILKGSRVCGHLGVWRPRPVSHETWAARSKSGRPTVVVIAPVIRRSRPRSRPPGPSGPGRRRTRPARLRGGT